MFRLHELNQLLEIMFSNHPSKWTADELFKGERLAKGLVVVNDMAERWMALIQDFSTRIEKGLGSVSANPSRPQVVSENQQQFPDCTKKIIVVASIASTSSNKWLSCTDAVELCDIAWRVCLSHSVWKLVSWHCLMCKHCLVLLSGTRNWRTCSLILLFKSRTRDW